MKRQNSGRTNYSGLLVGLLVSLIALGMIWQRDYVRDSFMLLQYAPSQEISSISERSEFSDRGERYFFASHPEIFSTTEFSQICQNHEKSSVVLGCYANGRIYLFNVDNTELDGIVEVTAAHEVLHAAFARLSSGDREKITALLLAENERLSRSDAFRERMSVYDSLSADERVEELYSVIGTEIAVVSTELEEHYSRVFEDRQAVVGLYEGYQSVFKELRAESSRLASSLDRQADEINQKVEAYNRDSNQLSTDIEVFNQRATNGTFSSEGQFEAERAVLVTRSDTLEDQRATINDAIDTYNDDKRKLDELVGHLEQLSNSIDSKLAPPPAVESAE